MRIKSYLMFIGLLLGAVSNSWGVGIGGNETKGDCSPILSKINADVTIVCSDPLAVKAVESLIERVEKFSVDASENQKIIEAQLKYIEELVHKKQSSDNSQRYDLALKEYANGNTELLKQILDEVRKTKYEGLFSEEAGYAEWPELKSTRRFIVSSFVNNASCPEDNGLSKSVMKIKINNGEVQMKLDGNAFKAKLSEDRKVIIAEAAFEEEDGITTLSGEARIRRDGTLEGEFPWVWTEEGGRFKCTGTTILSSIDN